MEWITSSNPMPCLHATTTTGCLQRRAEAFAGTEVRLHTPHKVWGLMLLRHKHLDAQAAAVLHLSECVFVSGTRPAHT